jgi:hypothetical protein
MPEIEDNHSVIEILQQGIVIVWTRLADAEARLGKLETAMAEVIKIQKGN